MSILLVEPPADRGQAIAERLLSQGDEVRMLLARESVDLRALGVHIAVGDPADDDLIERAGQNARTIVVFDPDPDRLSPALEGAGRARIERLVLVADTVPPETLGQLSASAQSFVVLRTGKKLFKKGVDVNAIARAVDAADDLAGDVKLDLDLTEKNAWRELGLDA